MTVQDIEVLERANRPTENRQYNTFYEYKKYEGNASKGKQLHHIVEQNQIKNSGIDPREIYSTWNTVEIDKNMHKKISAYYSSIDPFISSKKIVRAELIGKTFNEQYEIGVKELNKWRKLK